ncbi:MAG TPA: hypothetical protein VME18_01235 [Acidobacteriaceae bacterium]|nr:hypothetical protein [Acidobacteriaceae bacterium]
MRKQLLLLICVLVVAVQAQGPPAAETAQLPPGTADLARGWRSHSGDNPAWATPEFDDSSWQPVTLAPAG